MADLVGAISKEMGQPEYITYVPWARGIRMMEEYRPLGMFPMLRTESREKMYQWSRPVYRFRWGLYETAGAQGNVTSLEEARKVKIGVVRGDSRVHYFEQRGFSNIDLADNQILNIHKLLRGRVRLMPFSPVGLHMLKQNPEFRNATFRPVVMFDPEYMYVAFSKATKPEYIEAWNKVYEKLCRNGTVGKVMRKWHLSEEDGCFSVKARN